MEQNLPFDLDALLVFGKVVDCRSISKAATALGMPKSTVSRKLTKLESDLGIKLLRQSTTLPNTSRASRSKGRFCSMGGVPSMQQGVAFVHLIGGPGSC
ncbi:hypothetical protein A9W93_01150 [Mycobacterium colombiense]|nr:hypothetical protein A9W93_01150 [Mycobacterium colombiense]